MKKFLVSLFTIILVVAALQGISVSSASKAFASDTCPDGVSCIVTIVDLPPASGGTGSGGSGVGGGPSGGSVPVPNNFFYTYASCYYLSSPTGIFAYPVPGSDCTGGANSNYNSQGTLVNVTCPVSGGKAAIFITYKYQYEQDSSGTIITTGDPLVSYTCNYPAAPLNPNTVKNTIRCYTTYSATLYQAQTKSGISPGNGTLPQGASAVNPQSNIQAPGPGNGSINTSNFYQCGSFTGGAQFGLNTPENGGYGYYRLDLNPRYKLCTLYGLPSWTGNNSKDHVGCGGIQSAGIFSNYAISACNYNYLHYGNYASIPDGVNFAINACASFQCVVDGNTTVLGHTDAIQVIRNGALLPVQYATIHIVNGADSRPAPGQPWVIQAQTNVIPGSSPNNTANGTTPNSTKQYYALYDINGNRANFGTWEDQNNTQAQLAFNWASDTGLSWKMARTYRVTNSQFYVPVPSTTGGGSTMQWQTSVVYCGESDSNAITVVRSVNTNG